jgi:hypothetical protein
MTNEQINIAIAEACGWRDFGVYYGPDWDKSSKLQPTHGIVRGKVEPIPDYVNDLNACSEMEERLTEEQCREYNLGLSETEPDEHDCPADGWGFHRSARQRAILFCRTLNLLD